MNHEDIATTLRAHAADLFLRGNLNSQAEACAVAADFLERGSVALERIYDIAGLHSDDDADPDNTSPLDAHAWANGIVRQIARAALAQAPSASPGA